MANTAYQYRLYPNPEQAALFVRTFGCCRKVWNLMLFDKIAHYASEKKMLQTTPAQYKKDYPYLKEVDFPGPGQCPASAAGCLSEVLFGIEYRLSEIQVKKEQPRVLHHKLCRWEHPNQ